MTDEPPKEVRLCSQPGCARKHRARGLCAACYQRERRAGDERPNCTEKGCEGREWARGLCTRHYARWRQKSVVRRAVEEALRERDDA